MPEDKYPAIPRAVAAEMVEAVIATEEPAVDAELTNRVAALERELDRLNKILRNHAIY